MPRRKCQACPRWFTPKRKGAQFCSAACKQRAYRRRRKPGPLTPIDCVDEEHEGQSHLRAAQWQVSEALRLADEFALFRDGAPKASRRMLASIRSVSKRWRRLAAELAQKRGG